MIAQAAADDSWKQLLIGVGGGGGLVAIVGWISTRGKNKADAAASLVSASGNLLDRYIQEVEQLAQKVDRYGERISFLEGKVDTHEREKRWLVSRIHQLEEYIRSVCNFPVPHPVIDQGEPE